MSTTVSKFERLKVNIVSTDFTNQKRHGQTKNYRTFSPAMKSLLAMLIETIYTIVMPS